MFTVNQQDFYERWMQKANDHRNEPHLYSTFDRFIALYIVYNFLYVEVFRHLKNQGKSNITSGDQGSATNNIIIFFGGAGDFCSKLDLLQRPELEKLRDLVNPNDGSFKFNIYLNKDDGNPNLNKDKKLVKRLQGRGRQQVSTAVLDMIYQVRCNLFHGRKGIDQVQAELLEPLSDLLRDIIERIYTKLDERQY